MNPPFGAVTVVTAAYLPWARALFESLRERHPEAVCAAILVDRPAGRFELAAEPFEVLPVEALGETGLKQLLFRYTRFERVMAFKALGLAAFWKRRPELEKILYLDADLWILRPLDEALALLESNSLILTPHTLRPVPDARWMNERVYLRTGAFNLGFMGLRAGEPARRFLDWWTRRMREYCVCDPASGFFADQKWLDLAPSLFDGVAVLRSPGYNVAAWNLGDRPLARDGEGWTAAGAPLAAMHFSAFDPSNPEDPAWLRAGPGVVPDAPPALLELARAYAERLRAHGWETCRGWAHAYDAFDDGQPIPPLWHIYYRDVLRHRLPADYDPYAGLPYSPALGLLRQLRGDPARFRETWWYREWLRALRYAGRIPPWWDPHAQA